MGRPCAMMPLFEIIYVMPHFESLGAGAFGSVICVPMIFFISFIISFNCACYITTWG